MIQLPLDRSKNPLTTEQQIENGLIAKLNEPKYTYRADLVDRTMLEQNFRAKFEELNRVRLTDGEFTRLLDEIITPDMFAAAKILRGINAFSRDDGTPLNYTLVNIKDWCKNHFEVINQLRINTNNSHHRYDVILLINGVPNTRTTLAMDTPRRCFASSSSSSSAIATAPITSPTTIPAISPSMPKNVFCRFMNTPMKATRRSPTSTPSASTS